MKLFKMSVVVLLLSSMRVLAQNPSDTVFTKTTFTDADFRSHVIINYDSNKDKLLQWSEVWNTNKITVQSSTIQSLKGIEIFSNLDTLNFFGGWDAILTSIDLSKNEKMKYLQASNMRTLTSVIVSKKAPYVYIGCNDNGLTSFDVEGISTLKTLKLGAQKLVYLNIKGTSLEYLNSFENPKLQICVDNEIQWNAITNNDIRLCKIEYPNASYCDYELTCITTGIDLEGNISFHNLTFKDYTIWGQEIFSNNNPQLRIRKYENGYTVKVFE